MAFFIVYTEKAAIELPDNPNNNKYPVYIKKIHNSTIFFNLSRIWYD